MKTVLIIEDNNDIRENTAEILELAGYRALTAENGKVGVQVALEKNPDIIVCDIMMPELDGYGVLHLLRKNDLTRYTPFIFLTARIERADFRKGMEMGADDYITKPFEEIELLSAVEQRLRKQEALTQQFQFSGKGVADFLQQVKLSGLIPQLSEQYNVEHYAKKQQVYQEGRRSRFLYVVLKGKIKVFRYSDESKEYITSIYAPGDFVGYHSLLENSNYTDNASAMEDSELLLVPREDFFSLLKADPSVMARFIQIISQDVKEKEERLLQLAYGSLRKRVAIALLDLLQKYQATGSSSMEISRDDIAHYVGTATESLIRTLSDFKSEKRVEIREGRIHIPEPDKLREVVQYS